MGSTDHISFTTFVHPDAKADFDSLAPTRKELKQNLAQSKDARRCSKCGSPGNDDGLKVCAGCKLNRYCSRECQVADWRDHKKACKAQRQGHTDEQEDENYMWRHPELAMKLAQRVPSLDYLMHLFQLYAILSMDLLDNSSNLATSMLQATVATMPADMMAYIQATINGQDTAKLQIMLHIPDIAVVPLSLTPAMQRELEEIRRRNLSTTVVPIVFANKTKNVFFHPTVLSPSALEDARNKPPIRVKSTLSDITELPLDETNLRDSMCSFIRLDKKNQMKLRAVPK